MVGSRLENIRLTLPDRGGGGGGVVVVVVGVWGGRVEEKIEFNGEGIWVILHQNKQFLLTEG